MYGNSKKRSTEGWVILSLSTISQILGYLYLSMIPYHLGWSRCCSRCMSVRTADLHSNMARSAVGLAVFSALTPRCPIQSLLVHPGSSARVCPWPSDTWLVWRHWCLQAASIISHLVFSLKSTCSNAEYYSCNSLKCYHN